MVVREVLVRVCATGFFAAGFFATVFFAAGFFVVFAALELVFALRLELARVPVPVFLAVGAFFVAELFAASVSLAPDFLGLCLIIESMIPYASASSAPR